MNGRLIRSASMIVAGGLALGLAAGCASKSMSKTGSGDVVADRQRLMKLQGASWADIQAKAKAGNIEGIAVNAETLSMTAQQIPGLFPEGSGTEKSKAKPLEFHLTRLAPLDQILRSRFGPNNFGLVNLETRVFGQVRRTSQD